MVVRTVLAVALVDPRKHLMGLVYDHQVERIDCLQNRRAFGAAGQFTMCEEDAIAGEYLWVEVTLPRVDSEESVQLRLPLAEQRLGDDEQDSTQSLRHQLRDNQPCLDRLPESDLVREDASAFRDAT